MKGLKKIVAYSVLTGLVLAVFALAYFLHPQLTQLDQKQQKATIVFTNLTAGLTQHHLWLKPGGVGKTGYVLYADREGGAEIKVHRVESVYKTEELPMPKGLNISVEPLGFMVRPHEFTRGRL